MTTVTAHSNRVVTWQSPSGQTIDVCRICEERLNAEHTWPRDGRGEEYCQVSRGEHHGECDLCRRRF